MNKQNRSLALPKKKRVFERNIDKPIDSVIKDNNYNPVIRNNILDALDDEDIRELEELEDGSTVYEIGKPRQEEVNDSFNKNLADTTVRDNALKKLSVFLLESIDKDIEASEKWMKTLKKVREYTGFEIEDEKDSPFKEAARTYDTTLGNAIIRNYVTLRAEFLPPEGPVGYVINGYSSEELEDRGDKMRRFFNNYLVRKDKGFYPDYEKFIFNLGFDGSSCRKVYYDKFLKLPIARFIRAEDFIIDADCNSVSDSQRITHVLHLSKREILLNQQNGSYRDVELPFLKTSENSDELNQKITNSSKDDVNLNVYEKRSLFPIYECHVYLNLDDFNDNNDIDEKSIPLPFIVILDPNSKEILSIRRNWEEDDEKKEKINYFVFYNTLAGFGIRGLGLAHLLGSNAISLTTLLRILTDAGKFQNLQGGLRKKGIKQQQNNITIGAGEFVEVDTGGEDLEKVFMPLPYSGPSQALIELMKGITEQTRELGSTTEMGMMDSKEAISPATAMLFLDKNNAIKNAISRSIHHSFSEELELIYNIFKKTIPDDFSEYIDGEEITIDDFRDEIKIIPIADPSNNSTVHRVMKAQSIMEAAMSAPELHNMHEVYKLNYKAQGISEKEIEKILKPDPEDEKPEDVLPLDPISENLNIMDNKPVKAARWQNHAAHIVVHGTFGEENPDFQSQIMAHIQEHKAEEYVLKMEQMLGYELPSIEELQDPEIQNTIALAIADKINDSQEQNEVPPPIDPNELLMADIRQKEEENAIRERIANLKAEVDVFKSQLDFEKQKAKIESDEDIAKLRAETELAKQEVIDG